MSLSIQNVSSICIPYTSLVPKLWTETIEEHRREVRDAIVNTTAALVAQQGLRSVTMSQIAEETKIGRATLYKYFPDVESILRVWHEDQIADHLERLAEVRARAADPEEALAAVLKTYAELSHASRRHHDRELAASLHGDEQVESAARKVHTMIRELLVEGAEAGAVRDDVSANELASYCLNALAAAGEVSSSAGVDRIVRVTLGGLRPQA
jgi:AcrR family transcriptional regulator